MWKGLPSGEKSWEMVENGQPLTMGDVSWVENGWRMVIYRATDRDRVPRFGV